MTRLPHNVSYEEFFLCMQRNVPVIIEGLTMQWPALKNWVKEERPHLDGDLLTQFSEVEVPVAYCQTKQFNDQKRTTMRFSEFARQFESEEQLYLKDWHMVRDAPPHYTAYRLPLYFSDDWINDFWDHCASDGHSERDDYRFVYIGQKGSFTPLHKDVFRSYSWSTNVCGKKLWTLFPVEQTSLLFGGYGGKETVWDIREWPHSETLQQQFPQFGQTKPLQVIQQAGETIFVPSGWYHQVENLEDTLSINHNWGNACNIDLFWDFLQSELREVEEEIADCRALNNDEEWYELCQKVMNANTGLNYSGFVDYVEFVSRKLEQTNPSTPGENNYLQFQLMKLLPVLREVIEVLPPFCHHLSQRLGQCETNLARLFKHDIHTIQ